MKTISVVLAVVGAAAPLWAEEKAVPESFPEDRYQDMVAHWPFALATPVAAPVTPDKSFADGWYLAGASQFDGKDFVTVRSRDQSVFLSLYGDEPKEGVKLHSVEWSPTFGRTTATVEKDGQFAKLELLPQGDAPAGGPASMPGVNPAAGGIRTLAPNPVIRAPGAGLPQPNNALQQRNVIPRPSQPLQTPQQPAYQITPGLPKNPAAQPMNPAANPNGTAPSDGRRRIRVNQINSAPAQ